MNAYPIEQAKQNPILFPVNKADIATVKENNCLDFLVDQLGFRASIVFEHCLYDIANMLSPDYQGGYWEFAEIADGEVFFCYPSDDKLFACQNAFNYAEGLMDNKTFGFICSYIALGNAFYHVLQSDSVLLRKKYHNARIWAFEKLRDWVDGSYDAALIAEYGKFSRAFAEFID